MDYKVIDYSKAPKEVLDFLDKNKYFESQKIIHADDKTYVIITRGQKKTGGYGLKVIGFEEYAEMILIKVKYIDPSPDTITIQMITYPFIIIELEKTNREIVVEIIK
ncbi:hypothetical protein BHF71_06105 [Vulcanibacillus modesticaldus]|uniref:PrcB C-terminal domain-containing protein n=1 Tax=Vulcanibacillus modesticaldus TaxID=337097 RepID=A0A1D2YX24_9BACI|nr:protease complex subunit PrcB family protein [Vulcanibacillus modesticaldus]OEG00173.1 hypothetical protein BHF71_06105 [Vulcanibacillus modesticaldus]